MLVGSIIQQIFLRLFSFAPGTVIMFLVELYAAKALCKKWDERKANKEYEKAMKERNGK